MKEHLFFSKGLFVACMIVVSGLFFNSCSKGEPIVGSTDYIGNSSTRSDTPGGHWLCKKPGCGFFNPPWRDKCMLCDEPYSAPHGGLLVEFFSKILKNTVKYDAGGKLPENIDDSYMNNRIIIPGGILMDYAPSPWFNSAKALKYYNDLKTLTYYSDPAYAEGVEVGWYRTVRMLYPGISNQTKVESIHARWITGDGRRLKDSNGRGLKAGTQAAIDAFGAR